MEFNNISFIRVPKTGSSSIIRCWSQQLKNGQPRHKPNRFMLTNKSGYAKKHFNGICRHKIFYYAAVNNLNILELQNELFKIKENKIFTFGFVRNPWDRAVSSWKFCMKKKYIPEMSFVDFCRYLKNINIEPKNGIAENLFIYHAAPQYNFLICEKENLKTDFIGRFENLQEDWEALLNKLSFPLPKNLPHINTTKHKHYTEYYNDEAYQIINEKYKKDIEYFDYDYSELK